MKRLICGICLLITAILIGACFSPWSGEEGNLSITWSNTGSSRAFLHQEDLETLDLFEVTLRGPGASIKQEFTGVPGASFSVAAGTWSVTVKGRGVDPNLPAGDIILRVMGIEQIEVKPGEKTTKTINMYNAAEVESWDELSYEIAYASSCTKEGCEKKDHYHDQIILLNPGEEGSYEVEYGFTINVFRPVILVSEEPLIITRSAGNYFFEAQNDSILTLGWPGMSGTLTLDGFGFDSSAIYVHGIPGEPASFIMYDGVTIRNVKGSGVNVGDYGIFIMEDGDISNNNSNREGGGVYVSQNGYFEMKGGTISGNTASNSSTGGYGGGVSVHTAAPPGSFIMKGGTISGNTVSGPGSKGGGVYGTKAAIVLEGGTISDNTPDDVIYSD